MNGKLCFLITAFFFVAFSTALKAQKDTAFWYAPPEISTASGVFGYNLDTPIYVRISSYELTSTVVISMPANAAFIPITKTLGPNSTVTVELSRWSALLETSPPDMVLNTGLKITATQPISVYYDLEPIVSPEVFTLKGHNALGTSFSIPGQNVVSNADYNPQPYNSFDIIATHDNTVVTITPAQQVVGHFSAGVAYTETLNKGQTYSAASVGPDASLHLQGSTVTSNYPIAITVKDDLLDAWLIWGQGQDLTGDQIVPLSEIGTQYIAVRGDLNPPYDELFILGTQNGTAISQDGSLLTTIDAGVTYGVNMNNPSTFIQSSAPVYIWQLSGQGGELGSGILPPINCTGSYQVAYVRGTSQLLDIMILVQSGGVNNFLFNGDATVIYGDGFSPVPGTGGQWMAGKFTITTAQLPKDSPVLITNSTNLFHMGVVNGTLGAGASFGYFSNFDSLTVLASNTFTTCNHALNLYANDSIPGASYSWTGPNGFISSTVNPSIPNPTAQDTGVYMLTVNYNGCNAFSSTHVPIPPANDSTINLSLGNDTTYCSSFTRVLSAGNAGAVWSTGVTAAQITVTTPGTYWVTLTGTCGASSDTIRIQQSSVTLQLDPVNAACGQSNGSIVATATTGTAPFTYHWNISGSTDSLTHLGGGTYRVTVTDHLGCSASSSATINSSNDSVAITASTTSFCAGDSATICATAGFPAYSWNTGQSSTCIRVFESGNYYVTANDGPSCSLISNRIAIDVFPAPSVSISVSGDTLTVYDATGCQWYLNGMLLPGDTNTVLVARQPGTYTVSITGANACNAVSNPVIIKETGITNLQYALGLKIYPDPATDELNISYTLNEPANTEINIIDLTGRYIIHVNHEKEASGNYLQHANISALATGVYILNFTTSNGSANLRFIKE